MDDINAMEELVASRFDGSAPYRSLAIYYRKQKDYKNEIRVLETAVDVFEHDVYKGRSDRIPKLESFKARLEKSLQLLEKSK